MLESSSIVPGHHYRISELSDAIRNQTGKVPLIHCQWVEIEEVILSYVDEYMVEYLNWIGICLDKDYLEPVDCLTNATQFCHSQHAYYSLSEEEDARISRGSYTF